MPLTMLVGFVAVTAVANARLTVAAAPEGSDVAFQPIAKEPSEDTGSAASLRSSR